MAGMITVLYTKVGDIDPEIAYEEQIACLPSEHRQHCQRYKKTIDRQRCVAGKILLAKSLERYGISTQILSQIKTNRYGKPYIPAPFEFNISHSGEIAICAASNESCSIGIDIEAIVGIELRDFKETFNSEVFNEILSSADQTYQFYKFWTAIESAMKADGRGMELLASDIIPDFQSQRIRIFTKSYSLYLLPIDSNYACHLTTTIDGVDIKIKEI